MKKYPSFEQLKTEPAVKWEKLGDKMALNLAQYMQRNISAYSKFLAQHGINKTIQTMTEFRQLPVSDKDVYLRKYEYMTLFPKDKLGKFETISATSGSSGEEFYFPREEMHDEQYRYIAELYLKNQFGLDPNKKTLGIIGFGMGIWIGGIFTYKNFNRLADKYNLTLVPAGANVDTFLKAFRKFAPMYDQVILMGYPPFIKDAIDEGGEYGIKWKDHKLKILTAAEGYSEKFRDYVSDKASLKSPLLDTVNMYGTVELGTMGHETPISNLIRKMAVKDEKVFKRIFKQANRLPTLVQYHPYITYFEEQDGEVVATGYGSSIPLIRYRFPDRGGVIKFDEITENLMSEGIDILKEAKKAKIDHTVMKLPFVYIYDRSDHAVIIRGANIYPDEIKSGLQHSKLHRFVTGRFAMQKQYDRKYNEYLEVNVELKKNISKSESIKAIIKKNVIAELLKTNQEFSYLYGQAANSMEPKIVLWPHKYDDYFKRGGKQPWSINR